MTRARRSVTAAPLVAGCLCAHLVRAQEEEPKQDATQQPKEAPSEEPTKAPSPWTLLLFKMGYAW